MCTDPSTASPATHSQAKVQEAETVPGLGSLAGLSSAQIPDFRALPRLLSTRDDALTRLLSMAGPCGLLSIFSSSLILSIRIFFTSYIWGLTRIEILCAEDVNFFSLTKYVSSIVIHFYLGQVSILECVCAHVCGVCVRVVNSSVLCYLSLTTWLEGRKFLERKSAGSGEAAWTWGTIIASPWAPQASSALSLQQPKEGNKGKELSMTSLTFASAITQFC